MNLTSLILMNQRLVHFFPNVFNQILDFYSYDLIKPKAEKPPAVSEFYADGQLENTQVQ